MAGSRRQHSLHHRNRRRYDEDAISKRRGNPGRWFILWAFRRGKLWRAPFPGWRYPVL